MAILALVDRLDCDCLIILHHLVYHRPHFLLCPFSNLFLPLELWESLGVRALRGR